MNASPLTFWICQREGAVDGPYDLEQIGHLYRSGAIVATARVCESGKEDWRPLSDLRRCFPHAFSGVPVAAPGSASHSLGAYRVLAFFFGFLGVHNFYAGEIGSAVWKIFFSILIAAFSSFAPAISFVLILALLAWVLVEIVNGHEIQRSAPNSSDPVSLAAADASYFKRAGKVALAAVATVVVIIVLASVFSADAQDAKPPVASLTTRELYRESLVANADYEETLLAVLEAIRGVDQPAAKTALANALKALAVRHSRITEISAEAIRRADAAEPVSRP